MAQRSTSHGQQAFSYHPTAGHLATITAPDGETLTYGYDGSLLTSEMWSGALSGSVQYIYDNDFRPISQSVNGETPIPFRYDLDGLAIGVGALALERDPQNGRIIGSTLTNIADRRTYDSGGSLSSYRATFNGSDIFAVQYTRDLAGRITQKTETVDGQTTISSYGYDAAGRLIAVQRDGNTIATYAYDGNGNRLSYSSPDATLVGTYDAQDRLTEYGPTTYTYTANGELQRKTAGVEVTSYEYDPLGNLRAVILPNGTQLEYVIDGRNRRIGKKVNGTLVQGFLYAGSLRPVVELDGSGHVTARFIYGTRDNVPEYMLKGGKTYRLVTDQLGSPRIVIDTSTGHIVQRISYDAFGQVIFDDNPGFQPFGFAGGVYDPDTRLTRFGARDYDAETGRWTAKDPIRFAGGDTNLYGYVLNDPVNWVDPAGLEQVRNGIIYDDDGNITGEVGLATPDLFFDPIDYVAGGLVGLVKSSAAKIAGACLSGSGGGAQVFERVMSNAELEATLKTGLLRGGRQGENFFTNNASLDAKRAQQRLGLDGPLRDVRVRFEIQNDIRIHGPQPVKAGNNGTSGGGVEFYTTEPTVIKIIRTDQLRKFSNSWLSSTNV